MPRASYGDTPRYARAMRRVLGAARCYALRCACRVRAIDAIYAAHTHDAYVMLPRHGMRASAYADIDAADIHDIDAGAALRA